MWQTVVTANTTVELLIDQQGILTHRLSAVNSDPKSCSAQPSDVARHLQSQCGTVK